MNVYYQDASLFLRRTATLIDDHMSPLVTMDGGLFFAFGAERILKGILYDLNPIYVFKTQDFKNTVSLIYKDRLLPGKANIPEITQTPDSDVLSFRNALLRVRAISATTWNYSGLLFSLAHARDIIAHSPLPELDVAKLKVLLQRDFYLLVKSYSEELKIPLPFFIESLEIKLSTISAKQQESLVDRIAMKLESHRKRWDTLGKTPGFIEKTQVRTKSLLNNEGLISTPCPACGNEAVLTVEVYEPAEGEELALNRSVKGLRCLFCKLSINDYDEIDHLKLNERLLNDVDLA